MKTMVVEKLSGLANRILGRSDVAFSGRVYMRRWRVLHTKWFGVRVHNIVRSDSDREFHDHPFSFVSVILRGGYYELTPDGRLVEYLPGDVIFRSGDALHRLTLHQRKKTSPGGASQMLWEEPAWTLVFRGPVTRRWGFLDVAPGAWVDAEDSKSNQEARAHRERNGQARASIARPR